MAIGVDGVGGGRGRATCGAKMGCKVSAALLLRWPHCRGGPKTLFDPHTQAENFVHNPGSGWNFGYCIWGSAGYNRQLPYFDNMFSGGMV